MLCVSTSEYSKYANFFLPGAQEDTTNAVVNCSDWKGEITGILGWYCDNATGTKAGTLKNLTGKEWSITPRGIPGIGINDFNLKSTAIPGITLTWTGENVQEFNPKEYAKYMNK